MQQVFLGMIQSCTTAVSLNTSVRREALGVQDWLYSLLYRMVRQYRGLGCIEALKSIEPLKAFMPLPVQKRGFIVGVAGKMMLTRTCGVSTRFETGWECCMTTSMMYCDVNRGTNNPE